MKRFLKSAGYARDGIRFAFKSERNFRIQIAVMVVSIVIGIYLRLSTGVWGLVIISFGLVLTAELFNTALEYLGNELAGGAHRPLIKQAKDISAAAVFIASLAALVIGILFLVIPLVIRIFNLLQ